MCGFRVKLVTAVEEAEKSAFIPHHKHHIIQATAVAAADRYLALSLIAVFTAVAALA